MSVKPSNFSGPPPFKSLVGKCFSLTVSKYGTWFVCPFVCPSVCLSVRLSVCLFVCLSCLPHCFFTVTSTKCVRLTMLHNMSRLHDGMLMLVPWGTVECINILTSRMCWYWLSLRVWKEWVIEVNSFIGWHMPNGDSCGSKTRQTKVLVI